MRTKFRQPSWRRSHLDDSSVEGVFGLESDCIKKEGRMKAVDVSWCRQWRVGRGRGHGRAGRRRTCTVTAITIAPLFPQVQRWGRTVMDLRQTLRYMGVPVMEKSYMFGDNESVVKNYSSTFTTQEETCCTVLPPCS